ncbi:MAG TPA: DoxX family protein [Candidatus Lustribacter sp.]|jgi:putative oxidoreductase|nr:DoxX family protein [Candidatus Lustribacter sp.]
MIDTATESRSVIPGLGKLYDKVAPYSYAFMRFCTGAILAPHGIQKLFFGGLAGNTAAIAKMGLQPPSFWSLLVGFTECFCAIALALGLFTRVAALFIIGEMTVIAFGIQSKYGYFWTKRGLEFPLLLLLLTLAIFFRGGGRFSLDHLIGKEV